VVPRLLVVGTLTNLKTTCQRRMELTLATDSYPRIAGFAARPPQAATEESSRLHRGAERVSLASGAKRLFQSSDAPTTSDSKPPIAGPRGEPGLGYLGAALAYRRGPRDARPLVDYGDADLRRPGARRAACNARATALRPTKTTTNLTRLKPVKMSAQNLAAPDRVHPGRDRRAAT